MRRTAQIFDIMIASPSDCADDREAVATAIRQWNVDHRSSNVRFEALDGDRHTYPEIGSAEAQEFVNSQLVDRADLLIGLFWTRLGTPTSRAVSGTVEEIELVLELGRQGGLFFSQRSINPAKLDPAQVTALDEYRRSKEPLGLTSTYGTLDDLRGQVQSFLTAHAPRLLELEDDSESLHKSLRKSQQTQSAYRPGLDSKRLEIQAQNTAELDNRAIELARSWTYADRPQEKIAVLDVGCASGYVTNNRFGGRKEFSVEAIDLDPRAIQQAQRENEADNIRYRALDITDRGESLLGKYDLVFCALTIHHMASPEAILRRLWSLVRPHGALIVRTPDDGLKVTYPDDDNRVERILSKSGSLVGSSDRYHGRKASSQLQSLDPRPVDIVFDAQITSTVGMTSSDREDFFVDNYGYRADNAQSLARVDESNKAAQTVADELRESVDQARTAFTLDEGIFSVGVDLVFAALKG